MKNKLNNSLGMERSISSTLSLVIIILFSLIVAWYSLHTADKIIKDLPDSKIFNIQKRASYDSVNK